LIRNEALHSEARDPCGLELLLFGFTQALLITFIFAILFFRAPLSAASLGRRSKRRGSRICRPTPRSCVSCSSKVLTRKSSDCSGTLRRTIPTMSICCSSGIYAIAAAERMDSEDERRGTLLREATLALQVIPVNNPSLMRLG